MRKKLLFIGDGVVYTGFSNVLHNIIKRIPKDTYDIHHLAINYRGDPHDFDWKIYPAILGGDIYGINRLKDFNLESFSAIFILNDPPVIDMYLKTIKLLRLKRIPPIFVYMPIDGYKINARFFTEFDIVKKTCVYTNFAKEELAKIKVQAEVIPHGIDRKIFYRLFPNRYSAKQILFTGVPDIDQDSFIVLNANRNQPRKRIDLTLLGFKYFVEGKPKNVKLYLHCGKKDAGWYIPDLVEALGLEERVIMTETSLTNDLPQIPPPALNLLYNACDVGVNTCLGEGWGLTNFEHAVTGAPQVVPNHTSMKELFEDTGVLIDVVSWGFGMDTSVMHGTVSAEDLAEKLNLLYYNRDYYNEVAQKTYEKFNSPEYDWDNIVKNKILPLFENI